MALVRDHKRFLRYVFAVQYNGTPFLGFSYQGPKGENCINDQGVDLRGLHSVEGKIRLALNSLVNGYKASNIIGNNDDSSEVLLHEEDSNFENFQVSSRTDRGVHARKNTFHVDIRPNNSSDQPWKIHKLLKGLNYYLRRDQTLPLTENALLQKELLQRKSRNQKKHNPLAKTKLPPLLTGNEIRIIACKASPLELIENKHYDPSQDTIYDEENDYDNFSSSSQQTQPSHISWNARFTALRRTYVYRILSHSIPQINKNDSYYSTIETELERDAGIMEEFGIPFEDTWSWRVIHNNGDLDITKMREASKILTGTHDYSSFRGRNCSRSSPIVTIEDISIDSTPLFPDMIGLYPNDSSLNAKMVTVIIQGDAFLYRQVRNIVGCLVDVGKTKFTVNDVEQILLARDRRKAGIMAPAHGLYLANVEHRNLSI